MADDRDRAVASAAVQIVFAIEDAAAIRRNAEDVEHFAADPKAVDDAFLAFLREVETGRAVREDAFEGVLIIADCFPKRVGEIFVAADVKPREAMRIGNGKRTEHHGVHDAKNGGVRADAERERKNRGYGEAARAHEIAPAVAKI